METWRVTPGGFEGWAIFDTPEIKICCYVSPLPGFKIWEAFCLPAFGYIPRFQPWTSSPHHLFDPHASPFHLRASLPEQFISCVGPGELGVKPLTGCSFCHMTCCHLVHNFYLSFSGVNWFPSLWWLTEMLNSAPVVNLFHKTPCCRETQIKGAKLRKFWCLQGFSFT